MTADTSLLFSCNGHGSCGVIDVSMGGQLRGTGRETEARKGPPCLGHTMSQGRARTDIQRQSASCGCKQQKLGSVCLEQ